MPSPPLSSDEPQASWRPRQASARLRQRVALLAALVGPPARAAAFWTAVSLPFLNVALLAHGLTTPGETMAFLGLLGVNILALYVGRPYARQ